MDESPNPNPVQVLLPEARPGSAPAPYRSRVAAINNDVSSRQRLRRCMRELKAESDKLSLPEDVQEILYSFHPRRRRPKPQRSMTVRNQNVLKRLRRSVNPEESHARTMIPRLVAVLESFQHDDPTAAEDSSLLRTAAGSPDADSAKGSGAAAVDSSVNAWRASPRFGSAVSDLYRSKVARVYNEQQQVRKQVGALQKSIDEIYVATGRTAQNHQREMRRRFDRIEHGLQMRLDSLMLNAPHAISTSWFWNMPVAAIETVYGDATAIRAAAGELKGLAFPHLGESRGDRRARPARRRKAWNREREDAEVKLSPAQLRRIELELLTEDRTVAQQITRVWLQAISMSKVAPLNHDSLVRALRRSTNLLDKTGLVSLWKLLVSSREVRMEYMRPSPGALLPASPGRVMRAQNDAFDALLQQKFHAHLRKSQRWNNV